MVTHSHYLQFSCKTLIKADVLEECARATLIAFFFASVTALFTILCDTVFVNKIIKFQFSSVVS